MYVKVCVCVCVFVCVCMYVFMYVCVRMYVCMGGWVDECVYVRIMSVDIQECIHGHKYTYVYSRSSTYPQGKEDTRLRLIRLPR